MPGSRRGASAGAEYAFIGFYDSTGNPTGGTPTAPAGGAVSGFRNMIGLKSMPTATPEPDTVQSTGDDTLIADFEFDSIATRRYTFSTAAFDMDLTSYVQGSSVAAFGDGLMGVEDVTGATVPDTCIIIQARTKKLDIGVNGRKVWSGVVQPLCSTRFLGRDTFAERAPGVYNWSVTPQSATQTDFGYTIQSAFGVPSARRLTFTYDNPIHKVVGIGNAVLTAFPLTHRPISAAKVYAYIIPAGYTTGGILATVNSVSTTAPYTATLSSAPPLNSKVVLTYEFDLFTPGF